MDNVTALLDQIKIAESLAKHYESFGDKQSADDARNESSKLLNQVLRITENNDIHSIK